MSSRGKKITAFDSANTLSSSDLFVVEIVANSTVSTTKNITANKLRGQVILGPYANDSTANTAGISVGNPYYTANGEVRVRVT